MSALVDMLQQERGAFAYSMSDLPGYSGPLGPAHFVLKEDKAMWQPARRYSDEEYKLGDSKVEEMLQAGIISEVPTTVRHASAVTLPMKRAPDGSWTDRRFAVDSRHINSNTVVDRYGMPLPEELFQRMQGARILSKLDMRSGFFQVELDLPSKLHTTFHWRGRCYAFNRLPFGHVNATAIFQRRMELELQAAGLQHCTCVFVDDICIYSNTMEEHVQQLQQLLQHFQKVGLRAHPAKTIVATDCLPYLGHLVTAEQLRPDPAKVAAMVALQPPDSIKRLQAHLGLFNYYRCYVPYFAHCAQPLYKLLQKGAQFVWTDEQQQAYNKLKQALTVPGLALQQPVRPTEQRRFRLYTDWSISGIAAVLNQQDGQGNEYMVACVSRSLNDAEKHYPAWKGELLATIYGIRAFRPYLLSSEFDLFTDHKALLWMLRQQQPTGQLARWLLSISEYQFKLVHRAGVDNPADLPSREPSASTADWTGSRMDTHIPQCVLPTVVLPTGQPDPQQYTEAELAAYVAAQGIKRSAAAARAAAERPSALLAAAAADTQVYPTAMLQQQLHAVATISAAAGSGIDQHDPCHGTAASLLGGGTDLTSNNIFRHVQVHSTAARAWDQGALQQAACQWVRLACSNPVPPQAAALSQPPLPGKHQGEPDALGFRPTQQLNTASVAASFFPAARQKGLILYEPFGGLCAGLEMVLRAGYTVRLYLYSDIDANARTLAAYRLQQLQREFPLQLPNSATQHSLTALPGDVQQVTAAQLASLTQQNPALPWLVVAGWPCQDLSTAGPSRGLAGRRSQLLFNLVSTLGVLQQQLKRPPPAYILENVCFQHHSNPQIANADFQQVCSIIGQPVPVDAAQFGSLAHRLRNFWSNLAAPRQLAGALTHAVRPAERTVQLALPPYREPWPVTRPDADRFYPCNKVGYPRAAWPTLMSRRGSYAFRIEQPGCIRDNSDPATVRWDEPSAQEREVALGYLPGSTAAEGLSDRDRCALLGQCIDANALQGIFAIYSAWHDLTAGNSSLQQLRSSTQLQQHSTPAAAGQHQPQQQAPPHSHAVQQLLFAAAAAQEALATAGNSSEVWLDHPTLQALQQGQFPTNISSKERDRVQHRCKHYTWDLQQQQLLRKLPDGSIRVVPQPSERNSLIQQQHERCGHYGVRRTNAMLASKYWWQGMRADTAAVLKRCTHCSRVNASFNSKGNMRQLNSIPISSMGFRWHADLAGPFPESLRGSRYVLVAVEAFSKWLEAIPIVNKEPETVAFAFLHNVLARFAAPGQVISDNGSEFTQGAFADLLQDCLIDHGHISAAHPQANGQAEKAVQTVKKALRTMCLQRQKLEDWDTDVAWLALGYRCTPHYSTGFAPYELMFARQAVVPPAVRSSMQQQLNYDDPAAAATDLLQRKQLVQQRCPEALSNLSIAQHRDQQRYALVRSAGYQPRVYRFQPGDYVYIQQQQRHSTLQPNARPSILRVKQVLPSGVVQLQGKCGRTAEVHMDHCAPCHLPHLDGDIDPLLDGDVEHIVCIVCDREEPDSHLLLCDICNAGYHTFCLQPPLNAVPDGDWLCPQCVEEGYTVADAAARDQQRKLLQQAAAAPNLYPDAAMRRRDSTAAALDQRLVLRSTRGSGTDPPQQLWGRVHFRGIQHRPWYFTVAWQDGSCTEATRRGLAKWLMPAATKLPANISISPPTSTAS